MSEELKPCPFCGGQPEPLVDATRILGVWRIFHRGCSTLPNFSIESCDRADAIDKWNHRAPDAELAALRARVAELEVEVELLRTVCPQCYGAGTYVPNYHTSDQVEADEGDPDACPNPRWSPNADAGDYSSFCGCPEVPCTLCDNGAALRATQERDALRARVAELEREVERVREALCKAERALANGKGVEGEDTFISRNGFALNVLSAALAPRAEVQP